MSCKCLSFNAQRLYNKIHELNILLENEMPYLVFITETWLNANWPDQTIISLCNYYIIRCDRIDREGGGACIIVNTSVCNIIQSRCISNYDYSIVSALINISKFSVNFICAYLPPGNNNRHNVVLRMNSFIADLRSLINRKVANVFTGDYNLPDINWNQPSIVGKQPEHLFANFCINNGLYQFVTEPTRDHSILDLILCDAEFLISDVINRENFSNSDHDMVEFRLSIVIPTHRQRYYVYDFNKADWQAISLYLSTINWNQLFVNTYDIALMWKQFYDILDVAISVGVPLKPVFNGGQKRRVLSRRIRQLISRKKTLWRKLKKDRKNLILREKFKNSARALKQAIFESRRTLEEYIINQNDRAAFYRYVNSKLKSHNKLSVLLDSNGMVITDPTLIAQELNNYFASVYTIDNNNTPAFDRRNGATELSFVYFDINSVCNVLKSLNSSTSVGPDNIPNIFLKKMFTFLASPLARLYEQSFIVNFIPDCWKLARIVPLHKKGPTNVASNYRPISLTSNICKVMEKIIGAQIWKYFTEHDLISKKQFGFQKNSSTTMQLLQCYNTWVKNQNNGIGSDAIYIDYSKAFDSVVHNKLLCKLKSYGFNNELLNWITNYLSNRSHYVVVNNFKSDICLVRSGVPQGTVLGPLFFIIFVNDMPDLAVLPVSIDMFADDAKVSSPINSIGDCIRLQHVFALIVMWSDLWQLSLNFLKTFVLHLGKANLQFNYSFNGKVLESKNSAKDLGVTITSDLKFHRHIENIISDCRKKLFIMNKCFLNNSATVRSRLFNIYVRPSLEYASVVWNPHSNHEIDILENIAISALPNTLPANYTSLYKRRLIADLLFYFKILNGQTRLNASDFFTLNMRHSRRGHRLSLLFPLTNTAAYHDSFACRQINTWNNLPTNAINASFTMFKKYLHTS